LLMVLKLAAEVILVRYRCQWLLAVLWGYHHLPMQRALQLAAAAAEVLLLVGGRGMGRHLLLVGRAAAAAICAAIALALHFLLQAGSS
jgi:hypothetical protein